MHYFLWIIKLGHLMIFLLKKKKDPLSNQSLLDYPNEISDHHIHFHYCSSQGLPSGMCDLKYKW